MKIALKRKMKPVTRRLLAVIFSMETTMTTTSSSEMSNAYFS